MDTALDTLYGYDTECNLVYVGQIFCDDSGYDLNPCARGEIYTAVIYAVGVDEDGDYELDDIEDSMGNMPGYTDAEDVLRQLDELDQTGITWRYDGPRQAIYHVTRIRIN